MKITFGGGCFWCLETIFDRSEGVTEVISGYSGGHQANPTYKEVCSEETGHAEVIQITYNPQIISCEELLNLFWKSHDPTTINRQGNDIGTQYRSIIFYHNNEQKDLAILSKSKLESSKQFIDQIVTEIKSLDKFYKAEQYHQKYYRNNSTEMYCQLVIKPKLQKLKLE